MFQRPLICTDGTDGLHRLTLSLPSLQAGGMTHVTFLSVVPFETDCEIPHEDHDGIKHAHKLLDQARDHCPEGLHVDVQVVSTGGRVEDTILDVANTTKSDLLIMGSAHRTLLAEKLFGSTASDLSQRSPVAMLILRPQFVATLTLEELDLRFRHLLRYLLVPYNDGDGTQGLVKDLAQRLQQQHDRGLPVQVERCRLFWAVEQGRREIPVEYWLDTAKQQLEELRQNFTVEDLQVDVQAEVTSDRLSSFLDAAREHDVSAIAIHASRVNNLVELLSVPDINAALLRRSLHPVLVLPTP
jgi:nucleotide-binding universal stress UspA family protein